MDRKGRGAADGRFRPAPEGKHEFRIVRGTEEVDRVEATLKKYKTVVINPKGNSAYRVISQTYVGLADAMHSATHGGGGGGGSSASESKGERMDEVDFGLVEKLPTTIVIYPGSSWTRTKIYRLLPKDFSATDAEALLTVNPHIYPAPHHDYRKAVEMVVATIGAAQLRKFLRGWRKFKGSERPQACFSGH